MDYGIGNIEINPSDLSVYGETGASMASYGQVVTAAARNDGDMWFVCFDSVAPGQLTDWGRGSRDRKKLAEMLVAMLLNLNKA